MSIELSILNLFCKDREVETINYGYIKTLPNLEKELNTLFKLVHAYYNYLISMRLNSLKHVTVTYMWNL
jgi:hypothetical protein